MVTRLRKPDQITIPVPFIGASATWTPTDSDAEAAWELLVELVTRTSVVDLAEDEGSDREALTSLHTLFSTSRALLRTHGAATARSPDDGTLSVAIVIVRLLNDVLRPFLSRWHPRLQEYEATRPDGVGVATWERAWGGPTGTLHHAFRADLRRLRAETGSTSTCWAWRHGPAISPARSIATSVHRVGRCSACTPWPLRNRREPSARSGAA